LSGSSEREELNTLLLRMVHFLATRRHFVFTAAVHDVHLVGPHAPRRAGRVHGRVAATHHGNALSQIHGGLLAREVESLHQIYAGEKLVCAAHAVEVLTGDIHEHGRARTGCQEDGAVIIGQKFVDGDGTAHQRVQGKLHAHGAQFRDFFLHDGLRQAELGDAVNQHAARLVERFKNCNRMPQLREMTRRRETRRPRPDNRHLASGRLHLHAFNGQRIAPLEIRHEPLQRADRHRLALLAHHAHAFALVLLRTNTPANAGQAVRRADALDGAGEIALGNLADEPGDVDGNRAAFHAQRALALNAAVRLGPGRLLVEPDGHFFKTLGAVMGVQRRHLMALNLQAFGYVHGNIYDSLDSWSAPAAGF